MQTMAWLLLGLLAACPARLLAADPASGLLRGTGRGSGGSADASAAEAAEGGANVTAQWGISWGSCYDYGCDQPYRPGQLCGCWPGCEGLGICCSDYGQACYAPTPAPSPPASCAGFGCGGSYKPAQPCQCNEECSSYGNCCYDYQPTCGGAPGPAPAPTPSPVYPPAPAPVHPPYTFYVYRAQSDASYTPKNVNAANLVGAMWYLQHEVVTETPPKFGISRILRYKVQTKAPARLLATGMDFGVRYAYDSQKCTGPGDCSTMYAKFGYFVGCNNFASNYPYPDEETHYAGGIWYSLPGEGACDGPPTGADDCTYSYSWPPEEITLDELTGGDGSSFWANAHDDEANARKVQAAANLFQQKYPDSASLTEPQCNFDFQRFWQ